MVRKEKKTWNFFYFVESVQISCIVVDKPLIFHANLWKLHQVTESNRISNLILDNIFAVLLFSHHHFFISGMIALRESKRKNTLKILMCFFRCFIFHGTEKKNQFKKCVFNWKLWWNDERLIFFTVQKLSRTEFD